MFELRVHELTSFGPQSQTTQEALCTPARIPFLITIIDLHGVFITFGVAFMSPIVENSDIASMQHTYSKYYFTFKNFVRVSRGKRNLISN